LANQLGIPTIFGLIQDLWKNFILNL
jgi:hypothetical protein